MAKLSHRNFQKPTPARYVKIGTAFLSISASIQGYALFNTNPIANWIGLGFLIIGTITVALYSE